MPNKLRHILMIVQAMLVMAMSVQSVLETSHHYVPPVSAAQIVGEPRSEALLALGETLPGGGAEDASTSQHEHENTVDHAMIGLGATPAFPPLRSSAGAIPGSSDLPAGYSVAMPERPPRRALVV